MAISFKLYLHQNSHKDRSFSQDFLARSLLPSATTRSALVLLYSSRCSLSPFFFSPAANLSSHPTSKPSSLYLALHFLSTVNKPHEALRCFLAFSAFLFSSRSLTLLISRHLPNPLNSLSVLSNYPPPLLSVFSQPSHALLLLAAPLFFFFLYGKS